MVAVKVRCRECAILDEFGRCKWRQGKFMNPNLPRYCLTFKAKAQKSLFNEVARRIDFRAHLGAPKEKRRT